MRYSCFDKSLRNVSKEVLWVPSSKHYVHWVAKTTNYLDGGDHDKQVAVLTSDIKEIKLLEVQNIEKKLKGNHGTTASSANKKELDTWKCAHKVFGIVFDTNAVTLVQKVVLVFFN